MERTRPHVLFLNRSFWPDTEATGQLLTELTIDLTAWFDVTVIAGAPNHVDESVDDKYGDLESHLGVSIRRAWHSRFHKHSLWGRLINLSTFAASAGRVARKLTHAPDIIVVESDPFFLPLIAQRLRRRFPSARLVCYLQDLYPDIAVAVGKIREGIITRTLRTLLFNVYRNCDAVIVLSRDMRKRCEELAVPSRRLNVVSNWSDTDAITPIKSNNEFRRQHNLQGQFVVMYSGNMGLAHDLDPLIDAAHLLRHHHDITWLMVGDGASRQSLQERARDLGLYQVRFLPYQPRNTLSQSLSAADVHVVSIRPGTASCVMPSKLYGILASGTPAIAITEKNTELHDLVHDHDVGRCCEPGDPRSLADHVLELAGNSEALKQLGNNARALAVSNFSRTRQTARIARILYQTIGRQVPIEIDDRIEAGFQTLCDADIPSRVPVAASEPAV